MKLLFRLFSFLLFLIPISLSAQEKGIDEKINDFFAWATGPFVGFIFAPVTFSESIQVPWVLFPLVIGAILFTFYFGFVNTDHDI